nr:NAD(P)/FAD-dependent oxidoreductase [Pseudomonadales bacterium]
SENLTDKIVGIIGTGASAVQAVPELAKTAKELYIFQRTPSSIDIRDDWPTDPNWARRLQPGWQAKRREKVLSAVEMSPEKRAELNALNPEEKLRRQENANIDYMMRIHRRIDQIIKDQATADALKPWYMFMCKRPCFHNEYLPSFNQNNVHLIDTQGKGITEISPGGPVFQDRKFDLDLLIYATGFEVQKTGIYNTIVGRDGINLDDKYAYGIRTLLGIHTHGYPNLFIMGGYQASFQFNLTDMLQTQGDHIAACIDYVRQHGYQTMDPTHEVEEWWVQEVIKHRGKTDRNKECTPGYYNFEGESNRRQDGNYNGGFRNYFNHQADVRERIADSFVFTKAS